MEIDLDVVRSMMDVQLPRLLDELQELRQLRSHLERESRASSCYVAHLESELQLARSVAEDARSVAEVAEGRTVDTEAKLRSLAVAALALVLFEYQRRDGSFDLATVRSLRPSQPYHAVLLQLDALALDVREDAERVVSSFAGKLPDSDASPSAVVRCSSEKDAARCVREASHFGAHESGGAVWLDAEEIPF